MKRITTLSLFPEIFEGLNHSIVKRAQINQLITIQHINIRDFATDKHHTVDDRPYGGGPGMLLKPEPIDAAITSARAINSESNHVAYLTPQGIPLTQNSIHALLDHPHLILLCGRYEGIDERVIEKSVDAQYSIGDYVLSGGEIPAMVLIDALVRLLPGALGDHQSAEQESFTSGLLDYPHYTRPEIFADKPIPDVLLSGDHQRIARWRHEQALIRTYQRRPDLLKGRRLTDEEQHWLDRFKRGKNDE